jgi:hypothetical protein
MNDNKNIFGEPMDDNVKNIFGDNAEPIGTVERVVEQPAQPMEMPVPEPQPETNPFTETPQPIEINNANEIQNQIASQNTMEQNGEKQVIDPLAENEGTAGPLILAAIINALAIFGIIYGYLNINKLIIFALPAFIVVLTIIFAIKQKSKSAYPQGILVGGILAAIASFGLSILYMEQSDLYMYYTIVSVATGVLGIILSSIITTLLTDIKNVKALKTIGYLIIIGAYVGVPFYLYKAYPEELFKYVFFEQIEVVAETEDEFILKTLKNRYGENFTCDVTKIKHAIDQKKQRMTIRPCTSANGTEITVQSFEYEPSLVQYTIIEDYLDKRYFNQLKEELETKVVQSTMASSVQISLYSSENCNLVADCVDCEDYLKNKNELNDRKNQYEASTKLNFQKDLTINAVDFANNGKYKYVITINGNYAGYQSAAFDDVINKTLTTLNSYGVKNTYGYEITIKSGQSLGGNETYNTEVYKVKGEASDDKTFKNPVIVE